MVEAILALLTSPIVRLFDPRDPFNLASLAGALACVMLFHALKPGRRATRRIAALLRSAFPRRILLHPSSLLDYKLFVATSLIYATGWIAAVASSEWVKSGVLTALSALAAASGETAPGWHVTLAATIGFVLVFEFNYWFAHWLMHRFEPMWEFHKLHHSAEVMTPMTEWRQHPVELLLFPACHAIGLGAYYAVMIWAFGPGVTMFTLFETNIILLALTFSLLHLRHTHLQIGATGWLGRLIQSPMHHQIHHSTNPAHFGKNLGLCLSVWDWIFGTLHVPVKGEKIILGVEGTKHESVLQAYVEPFRSLAPTGDAAQNTPEKTA